MQQMPGVGPPKHWPELVAYDGRMAARAIQHDRPDVRVIVVRENEWSKDHECEVNEQYVLSESAWEASAAPLTDDEKRNLELVVLLRVRQCRGARPQDTVVTEPPFVMRRRLLDTAAADDGAFLQSLRHARPFVKSDLEYIRGENGQEFPTYMMDFDKDAPQIYVRFPHIVLPDSWNCCLQVVWALTMDGLKLCEVNQGSYGNAFFHHLQFGEDGFCPVVSPAALAKAAHKMTMSWVQFEEREADEIQAVISDPTDPAQWDPATSFPDRWPHPGAFDPEDQDGGRPADLVVLRLFVDERGLEEGPEELREVVRRTLETHEAATAAAKQRG